MYPGGRLPMSIINDALKKAQKKLTKTENTPIDKTSNAAPVTHDGKSISKVYEQLYKAREDQRKKHVAHKNATDAVVHMTPPRRPTKRWIKATFVIIFYLACVAVGYILVKNYVPLNDISAFFKRSNSNSGHQPANTPPKKRKYKPGELVLSGTSLIDERRVALINDEIYEID